MREGEWDEERREVGAWVFWFSDNAYCLAAGSIWVSSSKEGGINWGEMC